MGMHRIVLLLSALLLGACGEEAEAPTAGGVGTESEGGETSGAQEGAGQASGIGNVPIESISCSSNDDCAAAIPEILECEFPRCVEGKCSLAIAEDGIACNDFAPCTENDICFNGVCQGTEKECISDNPCETGSCDFKGMHVRTPHFGRVRRRRRLYHQ